MNKLPVPYWSVSLTRQAGGIGSALKQHPELSSELHFNYQRFFITGWNRYRSKAVIKGVKVCAISVVGIVNAECRPVLEVRV